MSYDGVQRATVARLRRWFAGEGEKINAALALRLKGL
jgi:hypothetical protein